MSLGHHAQDKQDEKPDDDMNIKLFFAVSSGKPLGKRKGHGHPYDEQEQRHDQIPESKTLPLDMLELALDETGGRAVEYVPERAEYPVPSDDPEHVKTPQGVQ